MSHPAPSTMRRDIASAYIATAARIGSWVIITGIVYRTLGAEALAMLALVRGTLGILTYTSLGLGPALVRSLAAAGKATQTVPAIPVHDPSAEVVADVPVIDYSRGATEKPLPSADVLHIFYMGQQLAVILAIPALLIGFVYVGVLPQIHHVQSVMIADTRALAGFFVIGVVFRLMSEAPASMLQVRGQIAADNTMLASVDVLWCVIVLIALPSSVKASLKHVGVAFLASNLLLLALRAAAANYPLPRQRSRRKLNWAMAGKLLRFGSGVTIAQLADFLYAPVAYIIINRLIHSDALAEYVPASQIDSGLLMLVTAIAAVLFPAAALADARGDHAALKRLYLRGTFISAVMLAAAGLAVWIVSPWLFQLWMNDPMETTQKILPFVLIHTVVGGSGAVGRSILLGMGKVRPFTISVLIAGIANVIFSYVFVRYLEMGLYGIVLATIIVVVARAGIWTPWYVMKSLKEKERSGVSDGEITDP